MKLQVCVAQINYWAKNMREHVDRIKRIITDNRDADLIVFPELLLHGHPSVERPEGLLYRKVRQYYRSIAKDSDDIYRFIKREKARVIIGELKGRMGRFYNSATYIDKDRVESYFKTHVHWTENFIPGNRLKVFNSPFGKIGINICFDAAFPEVWRVLALNKAKVIVNISAVPKTFPVNYMWLRMKSAALNNQTFVIYANRPGDYFSGHSAVFDPRGETIVSAGSVESVMRTEIELGDADRWRSEEVIYRYRRPLLYRDIAMQHIKNNGVSRPNKRRTYGKKIS